MKDTDLHSATSEELIKQFKEQVIIHGELRNAKEANRAFANSVAIWGEIQKRGQQAVEMFLSLLESDSPMIRLAVAGKALFVVPKRAEVVLEKLAEEPHTVGFDARMTLQEWRAGRLKPLA